MCGGGAGGDRGVHLRRPRPDRERLTRIAIPRVCGAVQRVAAGEPVRRRPDRPMCTQCARVRRGVQCRELQRLRKEVLDLEGLQLVVAQVTVQRAGAARDRRRRRRAGMCVGRTGLAAHRRNRICKRRVRWRCSTPRCTCAKSSHARALPHRVCGTHTRARHGSEAAAAAGFSTAAATCAEVREDFRGGCGRRACRVRSTHTRARHGSATAAEGLRTAAATCAVSSRELF